MNSFSPKVGAIAICCLAFHAMEVNKISLIGPAVVRLIIAYRFNRKSTRLPSAVIGIAESGTITDTTDLFP